MFHLHLRIIDWSESRFHVTALAFRDRIEFVERSHKLGRTSFLGSCRNNIGSL